MMGRIVQGYEFSCGAFNDTSGLDMIFVVIDNVYLLHDDCTVQYTRKLGIKYFRREEKHFL
jgi:hypothetical protein